MDDDRRLKLAALKSTIARIEGRPPLADPWGESTDTPEEDGSLVVPSGLLQEIHPASEADAGAAEGFGITLAGLALTDERPAIVHAQLVADDIRLGIPYGPGMLHAGMPLERVILVRPRHIKDLLWTAEEASGCRAIGAIVLSIGRSHKELDFTATRRLSMRAGERRCSIVVVNHAPTAATSAATLRWEIAAAPSEPPEFDDRGVGAPRWRAHLRKGRLPGAPSRDEFTVERTAGGMLGVKAEYKQRGELGLPLDEPMGTTLARPIRYR